MNFIVDCSVSEEIIKNLNIYGRVFKSTVIDICDASVSTHPDMQIHFLDKDYAVCSPCTYEYYKNTLPEYIFLEKGNSYIGSTYPENCAYNIAKIQMNVICNTKLADSKILKYYTDNSYNIIHINQGYAKCNICPVCEDVFLTEDVGIYNATKNKLSPILLEKGNVSLKGFDYGFIGGATGLFSNKLLFAGSLSHHKEFRKITKIIKKYNLEYIELSQEPLLDVGSIISFL